MLVALLLLLGAAAVVAFFLWRRRQHPAESALPLTMGVSVHCGWASPRPEYGLVPGVQCPNQYPWAVMQTRDRIPELGEYDERDPMVTRWRCEQMQRGGIDYACYQVEWDYRSNLLLMSHCADNHPADSPVQFCLSFWDVLNGSIDSYLPSFTPEQLEESWHAFALSLESYVHEPNYLTIDGRPVLFLGYAHNTAPRFIEILREEIGPLYLVATCCMPNAYPALKSVSFDAFTEYLLYSDSWAGVLPIYRERWSQAIEICKATGIDYWVPATCGYDSRAWGSPVPVSFLPTPEEFTAHLKEAREFARQNVRYTRGQVITYAWNEFGEGGVLEPMLPGMLHDGDELLRAHAAAV